MQKSWGISAAALLLAAGFAQAQTASPPAKAAPKIEKRVVEEIIARVNNEIITSTDLRRARETLRNEVEEDCRQCKPEEKSAMLADREKNALADLISQSLLAQRAKDQGLNVETDVVRRLEEVRVRNNFKDLDELQRRVEAEGIPWEDFKDNIRKSLLTQQIIQREVGREIIIDKEEIKKYYEEHKTEFDRPETVYLREIFLSTVDKPADVISKLELKAKELRNRALTGDDFEALAKNFSDSETAKSGGDLGGYQRGQLSKEIEDVVFKLKRNEITDVIRTRSGFLILKVDLKFDAGIQPLERVENEIMGRLYNEKMGPALKKYLVYLREIGYVQVKPGFTDALAASSMPIVETEPVPEEDKNKKKKKKKDGE
jgi:peptidyl-prolyl cis-trans isomerase SurA